MRILTELFTSKESIVKSSIVQHFEQTANGTAYNKLGVTTPAYLAYNSYLLDLEQGHVDQYVSDFTFDTSFAVRQRSSIEQSGGMNDISIAMSGNYDDKVYLGLFEFFQSKIRGTKHLS